MAREAEKQIKKAERETKKQISLGSCLKVSKKAIRVFSSTGQRPEGLFHGSVFVMH